MTGLSAQEHESRAQASMATLRERLGILVHEINHTLDLIEKHADDIVEEEIEGERSKRGEQQSG